MVNKKVFSFFVVGVLLVGLVCSIVLLDFTETFTGTSINSTRFANTTVGNFSITQNGTLIIQNLTMNSTTAYSILTEKQANINLSRNFTITLEVNLTDTSSTLGDAGMSLSLISINSSLANSSRCGIGYVVALGSYAVAIYNSSLAPPDVPPTNYATIANGVGNITMIWNTNTRTINCSFYNGTRSINTTATDANLVFQNNSQLNLEGYVDGVVASDYYNFSTPYFTYAGRGYGSGADNGNARVCTLNNSANCVTASVAGAVNQITDLDGVSNFSLCLYNTTAGRSVLIANTTFASNADCINYVGNVTGTQPTFINLTLNNVWNATGIRKNYTTGFGSGLSANIAPFPPYLNFSHTQQGSRYYSTFDNLVFSSADSIVPSTASFVSPGVTATVNRSINNIPINVSAVDDYLLSSILIRLYNSTKAQINSSLATFSSASGSSFFNFTSLSDGTYYVNATVNDSSNNVNNTATLTIVLDTVAPVLSLAKSSATSSAIIFTATCTDATSGVNGDCYSGISSSLGVVSGNEISALACGTTITATYNRSDYAGNTAQTSTDMATADCSTGGSGGGGGGGSTPSTWLNTYLINETQFALGYSKDIGAKSRIQFSFDNGSHHAGIKSISDNSVVIEVASTSQTVTMKDGEEKKFDLNGDGYYDLILKLSSVTTNKANIYLKKINEQIAQTGDENVPIEQTPSIGEEVTELTEKVTRNKNILWIALIVLIIVLLLYIALHKRRKKLKR